MSITTELKVGAFTILGVATLVAMVVLLDGNPFSPKEQEFYTELENVGGVGVRTQVRVSGVAVGEVTSIDVLSKGAKVNFNIRSDVAIPKGSFLELRSRGVLGDVYIELIRDLAATDNLPNGSFIAKKSEANDFSSLMNLVGGIARNLQTVSGSLAVVFGSNDGQSSLQNILHNVEKLSTDVRDLISSQRTNIASAIDGLRHSALQLSDILNRNNENIDGVIKNAGAAVKDIQYFSAELKKLVSGTNDKKLVSILDSIEVSAVNVKEAMGKVQLIVDKVEKGEGSLGQLISRNDAANDLRATLKNVQDLLAPARRLQVEVDYKGEVRSSTMNNNVNRVGNHFNMRIRTRPDQYYLLGASDSIGAREVRTKITNTQTAANGTVTTRQEMDTEDSRGSLRYNAQFAKRFSPVGVRFGLFESYPGIAADVYMFNDKVTASVEAFQFADAAVQARSGQGNGMARVKAYSNYRITENLYMTAGVDNIGKSSGAFGFVGGGLRFTDDDFKSILSVATFAK